MKSITKSRTRAYLSYVLLLSFTAVWMGNTGCATTDQARRNDSKPSQREKDNRPIEQRLRVGMTKEEVRSAIGGDPKSKSTSSAGLETWHYNDNEKGFIPYYAFFGKFKNWTINFDAEGKVKDWSSGESRAF